MAANPFHHCSSVIAAFSFSFPFSFLFGGCILGCKVKRLMLRVIHFQEVEAPVSVLTLC